MTTTFFVVDRKAIACLRNQWDNLSSSYTADRTLRNRVFQLLVEKYSEDGRYYHNVSHIKLLLSLLANYQMDVPNPDVIQFSIWFHDSVYDTQKNDNEEESARLAADALQKLHVSAETIASVRESILATRGHHADGLSADAKLFLDLDLAILGMGREIYEQYSNAIRMEYAWVAESTYRKGRLQVLESFIQRERIYNTDVMYAQFEDRARKNILDEIASLG